MRCKWYFRDGPLNNFSEIPAFKPNSTWKPPVGDSFLSKMEHELFSFLSEKPQSYNLTKEEWKALLNLKEDRSILNKPADHLRLCGIVRITLQKGINSLLMNLLMLRLKILMTRHYLILLRKIIIFVNV